MSCRAKKFIVGRIQVAQAKRSDTLPSSQGMGPKRVAPPGA